MKRIIMIFAVMAAVLSSCTKNEIEPVLGNEDKDIVLNISVSDPGADTKALIKQGWVENDEISIWYDTNTDATPDLVITYNGTQWIKKAGATVSEKNPSTGDGKYAKALYNGTVKVASKDDYTFENNELTFNIAHWVFLTEVQVVVKGLTGTDSNYTLSCDKFTPLATGNGYTVGTNDITASNGTKASAVTGIANETNAVAFVFATADYSSTAADYKFVLTDNTSTPAVKKVYTAQTNKISGTSGNMTSIKALTIVNTKFLSSGATNGEFTVGKGADGTAGTSDDVKVHFSKGNLYAKNEGSTDSPDWKWNFYDKQYQFHSGSMDKISSSGGLRVAKAADTEIDLFCWGYNSTNSTKYNDSSSNSSFTDWGSISGLPPTLGGDWRTLTIAEWTYLLNTRTSSPVSGTAHARYLKCKVNDGTRDVYGLMIFPDTFNWPTGTGAPSLSSQTADYINKKDLSWTATDFPGYTSSEFEALEKAGVVFLPAAGYRNGASVYVVGNSGYYWSFTATSSSTEAYYLYFLSSTVFPADGRCSYGRSVRLVSDVQ